MNELTTLGFLDRLLRRREVIVRTLQHLEKERRQVDENDDWLDQAAYESRVALLDNLTDGYLKERLETDKAIVRIDESRYGFCIACHKPIDAQRLEASPAAEFCVDCKEIREEFYVL
jgi:RNA polymerase-binding protein DksA